ncbi:MAG: hypothetical protein D6776_05190 [Planctomycetota bacterium]|nr:MAG: hypothetical protein D6776_05190 [Planctomycetota bacterium]
MAGWCLAVELQRRGFEVVVYDVPAPENRRLIGGCTLRRAALEVIAAAYETDVHRLIEAISGARGSFRRLDSVLAWPEAGYRRILTIRRRRDPIGLSTRHARIVAALRRLARRRGIEVVQRRVTDAAELPPVRWRIDTTGRLGGAPHTPAPRDLVLAVQAPCVAVRLRSPLRAGLAIAPLEYDDEGIRWLSFFTPFHDPASPAASWYGIVTTRVRASEHERTAVLGARAQAVLHRQARAFGLRVHDPEATLAQARIPIERAFPTLRCPQTGVLSVPRAFSPGAPAIYVDGMLAQARGAVALGRAIATAQLEPGRAVHRALRGLRRRNRAAQALFSLPLPAARAAALAPVLVRPWLATDW